MVRAEQGGDERELAAFLLVKDDGSMLEGGRGADLRGTEEQEGRGVMVSAAGGGGVGAAVTGDVGGDGSGEVVSGRRRRWRWRRGLVL